MTCQYNFERPCRNPGTEQRHIPLPNGDQIDVDLCGPHADVFDALMWADKRRGNA